MSNGRTAQRDSRGSRCSRGISGRNSRQSSLRLSGSFRRNSISLKPKDVKSIFHVPPEEGGKTRIADLMEKYNQQKGTQLKKLKVSGVFEELQRGWLWNSFVAHWCELTETHLLLFTNRDDALHDRVRQ